MDGIVEKVDPETEAIVDCHRRRRRSSRQPFLTTHPSRFVKDDEIVDRRFQMPDLRIEQVHLESALTSLRPIVLNGVQFEIGRDIPVIAQIFQRTTLATQQNVEMTN